MKLELQHRRRSRSAIELPIRKRTIDEACVDAVNYVRNHPTLPDYTGSVYVYQEKALPYTENVEAIIHELYVANRVTYEHYITVPFELKEPIAERGIPRKLT